MVFSSGGISIRSILSSSLMRLCTCLALVACVAEAVDEGFELLDTFALVLVGGFELRAALGLLRSGTARSRRCRSARCLFQISTILSHRDVEEIAVVRDQDDRRSG